VPIGDGKFPKEEAPRRKELGSWQGFCHMILMDVQRGSILAQQQYRCLSNNSVVPLASNTGSQLEKTNKH
jgi:hypothetical protein